MSQPKVAKLFRNGASQAVRLPAEFRFDSGPVYIYRDPGTSNIILSKQPAAEYWQDFLDFMTSVEIRKTGCTSVR